MKILVVCQHYYPEQFRINDICCTLASLGYDVTVLTGLPNYPEGKIYAGYRWFKRRKEIISGVKVIRVPVIARGKNLIRRSLNYISFAINAAIKVLFLERDYDVVFVYQLSPVTMAIPALVYKKLTNTKVYLYCLDLWPESLLAGGIKPSSIIYKIFLHISKKIYNNVNSISVTSLCFIDYFSKVIGLNKADIKYLPQYVEDIYITVNRENKKTDNSDTINLLFAGNIGKMQSVETIIRAAAELRDEPNIKWHIVGDGSEREKCEKLAKSLGLLGNNVIFYGQRPISEMPEFYSKASAFLVTMKDNGFISYTLPGKIQSYMAAGKPIIGAINGEAQRIIRESNCGLCCAAEDYKSLAKLVKQFVNEKEKHYEYSQNAIDYYNKHFRKDAFISNLLEDLKRLSKERA